MNTVLIDILRVINHLAAENSAEPLVYVEGKGFFWLDMDQGQPILHSLDGVTLFDTSGLKIYRLDDAKSLSELSRNMVATLPQHGRNIAGTWSEHHRYIFGKTDLSAEMLKIAQKYNIDDIAQDFSHEYIKMLLQDIRYLTVEAIAKAERQKKSKKEIILLYSTVREKAEENDIIALEEIREKLLKLSGKQKRAENAVIIREAKKELSQETKKAIRKIKVWTVAIVLFIVSIMLVLVSIKINRLETSFYQVVIKTASQQNTTGKIEKLTEQDIIKAVSEYNQSVSKANQITTWRKQKIINCLSGKNINKTSLRDSIEKFANPSYRFWLNCKN